MTDQKKPITNKIDSPKKCKHHCRKNSDISGGIIFIFIGIIFLLNNFGVIPWGIWHQLWKFWPVFIIFAGVKVLLGRSVISRILIALFVLTVMGSIVFFSAPQLFTNLNMPSWAFKMQQESGHDTMMKTFKMRFYGLKRNHMQFDTFEEMAKEQDMSIEEYKEYLVEQYKIKAEDKGMTIEEYKEYLSGQEK